MEQNFYLSITTAISLTIATPPTPFQGCVVTDLVQRRRDQEQSYIEETCTLFQNGGNVTFLVSSSLLRCFRRSWFWDRLGGQALLMTGYSTAA